MLHPCCILLLFPAADPAPERATYLRPAGDRFATECRFEIQKQNAGWGITSVTERGKIRMQVSARYDGDNRLVTAEAVLAEGDQKSSATVTATQGKAKVERAGQPTQEFDVPAGVIVTSAPDWTDTFLLARLYDRKKAGKQEFAGLWIHPTQPTQLLRFTIEKTGGDAIEHQGQQIELDRCEIRLRGNSAYAAWLDPQGRLIRLIPLPVKQDSPAGMVREGFEKSALRLTAR